MRVFLVLLYLYASYVIAQPKNETFDFELYKNLGKNADIYRHQYLKTDGCILYKISFDKEKGGYIEESLPSPSFKHAVKIIIRMEKLKASSIL